MKAELLRQRSIYEANGIRINQVHGPWRWPLADLEPADRAERFESMSKSIRGAAYLGADYTVIHPIMPYGIGKESIPFAKETVEANFDFFSRLAEVGKEWGVTVCLENMPFPDFILATVVQITDFVKSVNHPYFKVCLDTGHALVTGEKLDEAVKYIGRELLCAVHAHDNDEKADSHLNPGQGIGDFAAFSKALREIEWNGVFNYETSAKGDFKEEEREPFEIALANYAIELVNE